MGHGSRAPSSSSRRSASVRHMNSVGALITQYLVSRCTSEPAPAAFGRLIRAAAEFSRTRQAGEHSASVLPAMVANNADAAEYLVFGGGPQCRVVGAAPAFAALSFEADACASRRC